MDLWAPRMIHLKVLAKYLTISAGSKSIILQSEAFQVPRDMERAAVKIFSLEQGIAETKMDSTNKKEPQQLSFDIFASEAV